MKPKKDSMGKYSGPSKVGTGAAPSRPSMAGSGGKVAAVRAVASKPSMGSSKPAMPGRAVTPMRPAPAKPMMKKTAGRGR